MNQVIEKQLKIENMIYEIRGKYVMLDSDLAKLFGYQTKDLNRNVKNNINRFPNNYCFKLTASEYESLRCKNFTLKNGRGEHRKYLPYVFTEHGITMLAGILKSDVAIQMSLKIVDTFITMKKYISSNLIEQKYINNQVIKNTEDIKLLQESFSKFEEKKKVNEIYFEGQIYDAYSKIIDILKEAKRSIVIIDAYSDKTILDIIRNLNIEVTLIVKSKSLLTKIDIEKYNQQYSNLNIIYNDTFHDRYFILDEKIIYHCGTSINRIGSKTFSINILEDDVVKELLIKKVDKLIMKRN